MIKKCELTCIKSEETYCRNIKKIEAVIEMGPYRRKIKLFYWKSAEGPTVINEGQFADSEKKPFTVEDIRFTVTGSYVYATCLNMQGKDTVCIKSLAETDASKAPNFHGIIREVKVLGIDDAPQWMREKNEGRVNEINDG